jgi:hypothetical protein
MLAAPAPDRFIRTIHATFQHQLFDLTQLQDALQLEPGTMSDDLRRKTVALVADFQGLHRHRYRLRPDQGTGNLRPVNEKTPKTKMVARNNEKRRGLAALKQIAHNIIDDSGYNNSDVRGITE